MSDVGTWEWAKRTDGALSRRDRLHLIRQGFIARLRALPLPLRRVVIREGAALELPEPPDSSLATLADDRVRELSSPELYGHCVRTWLFSSLLGRQGRVAHDPELLYLACVLHDLGLTSAHDGADPTARCFAVEGARAAHDLVRGAGATEATARKVAQAITLHLNVDVPETLGVEARLLSMGVSLDVVGRRASDLSEASIAAVVRTWPRDGFPAAIVDATERQATLRPHSRAALLHQLGFRKLVLANPLGG